MEKVAILDLGTNTFHLIIAYDQQPSETVVIERRQIPVKLAEGGIQNGNLSDEAFERAFTAIEEIRSVIANHAPHKIWTYATSAFRTTKNSRRLLDHIESTIKTTVHIIEGSREAEFIYYGVKWAVQLDSGPALILDIGGGSVEFIVANEEEIFFLESIEIGAARLIEQYHRNDPITQKEIDGLHAYFDHKLHRTLENIRKFQPKMLIGASGAFETLTDIELQEFFGKGPGLPISHLIDFKNFEKITDQIVRSSMKELYQIKGMAHFRVNMIVVACLLIRYLVKALGLQEIWFSDYAIKEGILYEKLKGSTESQKGM